MQINRLFEIVYLLLDKKSTTAKELAERFEVSVRTVLRDIEILSAAGIPIYTVQGKGGGISILDNYVLNKTTISEEEQNQILFALQSLTSTEHIDVSNILSKLRTLFDKTDTNWIEVDFSRWGNAKRDKERFEILKLSIIKKQAIEFTYSSTYGETTSRMVYPLKLIFKSKAWYLQGYCLLKQDYRTFKINRISAVKVMPETFADKELSPPAIETPDASSEALIHIIMKFSSYMAHRVYDEFDTKNVIKNEDGTFLVSVDLPEDYWLYGFLLSFGRAVQVLDPQSVKDNLLGEIEKIKDFY
ncbi:HTH domain protein [Oxobacter pfennigii]|uniref:HTH domain protein n=1 Tax=Oxobacter pfennigii TaxID=36849 RepID=A0A0P9ACV6_9CLOT|nr:YafY family protein [Oxobacter pfennigii]KPU42922.1 HTH domain protein [Oxobacter pfennigii]